MIIEHNGYKTTTFCFEDKLIVTNIVKYYINFLELPQNKIF